MLRKGIFLVEDNPIVRGVMADALVKNASLTLVGSAETESQAKSWMDANDWDIAVVDLFLRNGNGADILRYFRNRRADQHIVIVTNHAYQPVLQHCRLLGADSVFLKVDGVEAVVEYCASLIADYLPSPPLE